MYSIVISYNDDPYRYHLIGETDTADEAKMDLELAFKISSTLLASDKSCRILILNENKSIVKEVKFT